jgi:hypothetical protein
MRRISFCFARFTADLWFAKGLYSFQDWNFLSWFFSGGGQTKGTTEWFSDHNIKRAAYPPGT